MLFVSCSVASGFALVKLSFGTAFLTGAIQIQEDGDQKIIDRWSRVFDLKYCTSCGVEVAPAFQCEHFRKQADLPEDFFDLCRDCRVAQR